MQTSINVLNYYYSNFQPLNISKFATLGSNIFISLRDKPRVKNEQKNLKSWGTVILHIFRGWDSIENTLRNLFIYRISSYSFRKNYSFFNLEIYRSQYISPKVTVHRGAETIQGRKQYEEIRYAKPTVDDFLNSWPNETWLEL